MAEVTSLKIKLTSAERDRHELEEQLKTAQKRITDLETKLILKDAEVSELKQRITKNGTILPSETAEGEIEKLKKAVDSLMFANEEKDRRLEEYRRLLRRYKKIEEMVVQAQGRRALEDFIATLDDDASSTASSTSPSTGSGGKDAADGLKIDEFRDKYQSGPSATSTPTSGNGTQKNHKISSPEKPLASPISPAPPASYCQRTGTLVRSNSCEEMSHSADKTPPASKKKDSPYSGYAQSEVVTDDEGCGHYGNSRNRLHHTDSGRWKGFKKFLGRLKRSSSQDFDGDRHEEFRRGGIRATAGARLAWSKDLKITQDTDVPFVHWDGDRVVAWLNEIGLDMYVTEARRWVKIGDQLLKATHHDLEKELGMKNYLHRKKLQLALEAVNVGPKERISVLSFNWVTRWLDDIGIPQYKDSFYDARIDGLMLHYMTVDDLLSLKVTNELHHISIRRAIQALRLHNFDPQCLKRRPSADEGNLQNIANEVMLWSNHRVMEWLRTIDLSEYAPNLRGSGVHGALMVLEPRFNAELFSQVLSIPANKSLLRRHLSTHFVSLIGNDQQHKKREFETSPDYQPLFPNTKVKRRNNFLLFGHRRGKSESQTDSYICPIETPPSQNGKDTLINGGTANYPQNNGCIKEREEMAAKEIGAVSKEIKSLTVMLSQEKFLDNVPTSNV